MNHDIQKENVSSISEKRAYYLTSSACLIGCQSMEVRMSIYISHLISIKSYINILMIQSTEVDEIMESLFPEQVQNFPPVELEKHRNNLLKLVQNLDPKTKGQVLQLSTKELEHLLYRCPDGSFDLLSETYSKTLGIQIKEPAISNFYHNDFFPDLKQLSVSSSSKSIPETMTKSFQNSPNEKVMNLLAKIYNYRGYISNLERVLLIFPELFVKFHHYQHVLMESEETKLQTQTSYFFAFIAAAEYGCTYLMNILLEKYIKAAGDLAWIEGQLPKKITKMQELNHFLAYCPWKICDQLIQSISKDWSLAEILHASKVMSFYHCLSVVSLSFGLQPETDTATLHKLFDTSILNSYSMEPIQKPQKINFEELSLSQNLLDVINNQFLQDGRKSNNSDSADTLEDSEEKYKRITEHMLSIDEEIKKNSKYIMLRKTFQKVLLPCDAILKRDEEQCPPQYESDWNLFENGYSIMNKLSAATTDELFGVISLVNGLTLQKEKEKMMEKSTELDTKSISSATFRKSIRYYSDSFLGFIHDGYDYSTNMKTMLTLEERFFIMITTMYPFLSDRSFKDYLKFSPQNLERSLFLLVILIANNKMERALTYLSKCLVHDE